MIKQHQFIKTLLFILAFLLSQISCNNLSNKRISEGEIVFNIEYLDNERENPLIALLPKKMHTVFKDNSSYSLIVGFFGTFKIINIVNYKKKKTYSLFQILDKKYVYETDIISKKLLQVMSAVKQLLFLKIQAKIKLSLRTQ